MTDNDIVKEARKNVLRHRGMRTSTFISRMNEFFSNHFPNWDDMDYSFFHDRMMVAVNEFKRLEKIPIETIELMVMADENSES